MPMLMFADSDDDDNNDNDGHSGGLVMTENKLNWLKFGKNLKPKTNWNHDHLGPSC